MTKRILLTAALIAGLVPTALAQLSGTDKAFVTKAAKANNYEIKAANMAQDKSTNQAYKAYAQMILTDHTKAGEDLTHTVAELDPSAQMPTNVSKTDQAHLAELERAGDHFDTTYRDQMIATHKAAIQLFSSYVKSPEANPQLKKFAQSAIPDFQKHLRDAKKLPKQ